MVFKYLRDCCAEKGRDPFSVTASKEEWIEIHGRGHVHNEHGLGLPMEGVSPLSLEVCKYQECL